MGTFVIAASQVGADLRDFPRDRWYEAEIKAVNPDYNEKGNLFLQVQYEVFSPEHGTARMYDRLWEAYPPKSAALLAALSNMTLAEVRAQGDAEVDPDDFVGGRVLVYLSTNSYNKESEYPAIERPWFAPEGSVELLNPENNDGE